MYIDDENLMDVTNKIVKIVSENELDGSLDIDDSEKIYEISWGAYKKFIDRWRNTGASFNYKEIAFRCFFDDRSEFVLLDYLVENNLLDRAGIANATGSFIKNTNLSIEKKTSMLQDMLSNGLDLNYVFEKIDPLYEYDSIPAMLFCYLIGFYDQKESQLINLRRFESCSWKVMVEFSDFNERHLKFIRRLIRIGVKVDLKQLKEQLIYCNKESMSSQI